MSIHQRNWKDRPSDVSNLLNPAFLGVILRKCAEGYTKENGTGLPFELAFLVYPLVLHERTREAIPTTVSTRMQPWMQENREVLIDFGRRATELVPFVREAVMFCLDRNIIEISITGRFDIGNAKFKGLKQYQASSDEIFSILRKSEFVGRWLNTGGPSANIFAMLGVRP